MPDNPLPSILNSDEAKEDIEKHFADQVKLFRDLTAYGTNLIIRAFDSSKKDLSDIVVCGVLLKHIVAMLDAVEILLTNGMVIAAFLPSRSAFEASIYLDWILFSDKEKKAKCYIVANLRNGQQWASRAIEGTTEEQAFNETVKSLNLNLHELDPNLASDARLHLAEIKRILAQPNFSEVNADFDRVKGTKIYDPEWYKVVGAKSIRNVAKSVGRLPEYELFYTKGSKISHAASYNDHIRFNKGKISFKTIRNLENVDQLVRFAAGTAIISFRNIIGYYRASELDSFKIKYSTEWRKAWLSVRSVEYKT